VRTHCFVYRMVRYLSPNHLPRGYACTLSRRVLWQTLLDVPKEIRCKSRLRDRTFALTLWTGNKATSQLLKQHTFKHPVWRGTQCFAVSLHPEKDTGKPRGSAILFCHSIEISGVCAVSVYGQRARHVTNKHGRCVTKPSGQLLR
jgi:hypothetical protein